MAEQAFVLRVRHAGQPNQCLFVIRCTRQRLWRLEN
jgi:hypothetical protein